MSNEDEKGGARALQSGSHQLSHPAVPGSNPSGVTHSIFCVLCSTAYENKLESKKAI